jgi:hypothetical protein
MKRWPTIRRWTRRVLLVASSLLLLLSLIGRNRSGYVGDTITLEYGPRGGELPWRGIGLAHASGDVHLYYVRQNRPLADKRWSYHAIAAAIPIHQNVAGEIHGPGGYGWHHWEHRDAAVTGLVDGVIVPYWLLSLLFALAPVWWANAWRHRRREVQRQRKGLCPACGYDLRASPERCPECGALPAEKSIDALL